MKHFCSRSFARFVSAALGRVATPIFAEESDSGAIDSEGGWFRKILSTAEYSIDETYVGEAAVRRGNRTIDNFDESDTVFRLVLTPRIKLGVLRLGAEWERFSFGFPAQTSLPNTLQSASFVVGLDTQFSDSILLRFEAQPGFYGTNEMSFDQFNMPFIIGGTYIYNPNLQFIVGVGVDVERKYPVLPGAGIRWKFSRQWVANVVLPAPRLEYEATKNLMLYVGGNFKETSFRVSDDFGSSHENSSRLNHAVLTYSEVRAGVGAEWKIASFLKLSAEAGYQPYRSFDFYRANVRFHQDGSAPYGMLSVHGAF
jgi:Domain of unknown function (DUF6268)